jgi:hypothetical protein
LGYSLTNSIAGSQSSLGLRWDSRKGIGAVQRTTIPLAVTSSGTDNTCHHPSNRLLLG